MASICNSQIRRFSAGARLINFNGNSSAWFIRLLPIRPVRNSSVVPPNSEIRLVGAQTLHYYQWHISALIVGSRDLGVSIASRKRAQQLPTFYGSHGAYGFPLIPLIPMHGCTETLVSPMSRWPPRMGANFSPSPYRQLVHHHQCSCPRPDCMIRYFPRELSFSLRLHWVWSLSYDHSFIWNLRHARDKQSVWRITVNYLSNNIISTDNSYPSVNSKSFIVISLASEHCIHLAKCSSSANHQSDSLMSLTQYTSGSVRRISYLSSTQFHNVTTSWPVFLSFQLQSQNSNSRTALSYGFSWIDRSVKGQTSE